MVFEQIPRLFLKINSVQKLNYHKTLGFFTIFMVFSPKSSETTINFHIICNFLWYFAKNPTSSTYGYQHGSYSFGSVGHKIIPKAIRFMPKSK